MIERRRAERIRISDRLMGRVGAVGDARVIDISVNGALVEIGDSMKPEDACHFSMPVDGGDEIHVEARVRRCQASRYTEDGLGGSSFMYRAGLEFTEVDSTTHSKLEKFLARIKQRSVSPDTARIAQLGRNLH